MINTGVRDLCSAYPPVLPFFFGNIRKSKHPFQDQSFQTYPEDLFLFQIVISKSKSFAGTVVVSDPSFSDISAIVQTRCLFPFKCNCL